MPKNPEHTKYARITGGLGVAILGLVCLGCYLAYEFIQDSDSDEARDVGVYIGMGFALIFAMSLTICALTSNNRTVIQAFGCLSGLFAIVFIAIGGATFGTAALTTNAVIYAALCIVIACKYLGSIHGLTMGFSVTLIASVWSSYRLGEEEQFITEAVAAAGKA